MSVMELINKKCHYCDHLEHVIISVSVTSEDIGSLQGRLCEKCGHLGLFGGGNHSAHAPREIDPVNLPKIIQQIRNKYTQTQPIT